MVNFTGALSPLARSDLMHPDKKNPKENPVENISALLRRSAEA